MQKHLACLLAALIVISSATFSQTRNALDFDGVDDYVEVAANSSFDFNLGTIEFWVRPGILTGNAAIISNRGGDNTTRYSLHMSNSQFGLFNGTTYYSFPYTFTPGTWYHIAVVFENIDAKVYIDGTYANITQNNINRAVTGQHLTIGVVDINSGLQEFFLGSIDEVRVWAGNLTPAEIQARKNLTLYGNEADLSVLYSFDQGIPGGNNTSITTLTDKTSSPVNGTLLNFSRTGSTSNFVYHELFTLPLLLTGFTVKNQHGRALLQWQTSNEQNTRDFVIEASNDGSTFSPLATVKAAGSSSNGRTYSYADMQPGKGVNYYRLKHVDYDGKFEYSPTRTISFAPGVKLYWHSTDTKSIDVGLLNGENNLYQVTDLGGRMARQGRFVNNRLTIRNLPAGLYVIRVLTPTGDLVEKVAVE